jgi:hypothetical protein
MSRGCCKTRPCHVFTQRRGDVTQGRATYAHGVGAIVEYRRSSAGASVFVRVRSLTSP